MNDKRGAFLSAGERLEHVAELPEWVYLIALDVSGCFASAFRCSAC